MERIGHLRQAPRERVDNIIDVASLLALSPDRDRGIDPQLGRIEKYPSADEIDSLVRSVRRDRPRVVRPKLGKDRRDDNLKRLKLDRRSNVTARRQAHVDSVLVKRLARP